MTAIPRLLLSLLIAFTPVLAACSRIKLPVLPSPYPTLPVPTSGAIDPIPLPTRLPTQTQVDVPIALYFTEPWNPASKSLRGGPDRALADAIDSARISVDLAVLDLNLWSIRDALLAAHRRGVTVRIVVDSDYSDEVEIEELKSAGIPVLGDRREGLMHNKFAIIDRQEVWTGSMNYTLNDAYRNNNNLVRIHSLGLAEDYTAEFEEMFVADRFGPDSPFNTPHPTVTVGGVLIEVFFSPDDGAAERLVELIQDADERVYFLAFSFTADDLGEALVERAGAGVAVAGVMDAGQYNSNQGTEYHRLRRSKLDVRLDGNSRSMHHKVLIIDREIVVTGSYNFSRSAETSNDENVLVIHSPEIAAQFEAEFQRVYAEAER
jgi:phosphatidylserine/phosphatidylglycerophosphate/cardiolipin synthase-like enzyme